MKHYLDEEDIIIDIDDENYKKNNYIFRERKVEESFSLLDLLSEDDKKKLKSLV